MSKQTFSHKFPIFPTDAVFAITYKCNSRCVMCGIWKIRDHQDITPEVYGKIPCTLQTINISGGEPFLNPDIVAIIQHIKKACPRAKLIISSNGFLPKLILEKMKQILAVDPHIGVAISIDGIGEMQEFIRGISQGFEKNLETLRFLKFLGVQRLRIAYTATERNISHLSKVYDLSRDLGVEFTCAVAQSSDFYFGGKQNESIVAKDALAREFDYLIHQELAAWSPKRWARAFFAYGLKRYALFGEQLLPSEAGFSHFFMDPRGNIYPSVVHNRVIGNLQKQSFDAIWHSAGAEEARQYVRGSGNNVWMICTARTAIKKHPLKALCWLIKRRMDCI